MLLKTLINETKQTVSALYPEKEAAEMVFALLEHILGTKRHTHIIEPSYMVDAEGLAAVEAAVGRLASGEPLQYVLGTACFYGRNFKVSPSVLIPRPETEILCRIAIDTIVLDKGGRDVLPQAMDYSLSPLHKEGSRILDLCTGSGCIAWTMAIEKPGVEVVAVDISDAALEVAVNQNFCEELAETGAMAPKFVKADVLAGVPTGFDNMGTFDMILSNPPYVMDKEKALMRSNVLEHEPHLALFVSDDDPLIFYRALAQWATALLAKDGFGLVEINEALGQETVALFIEAGFTKVEVLKDFSEKDRFVKFA